MLLGVTFCQPDVVCEACKPTALLFNTPTRTPQSKRRKPTFTVDSGATIHCINDPSLFKHFSTSKHAVRIVTANNSVIYAEAIGTVEVVLLDTHGIQRTLTLHNVAYSPHFHTKLISVRRLWRDSGIKTRFGGNNYFKCIHEHFRCKFDFRREFTVESVHYTQSSRPRSISPELLHSRFGHASPRRLKLLMERSHGYPKHDGDIPNTISHDCDACRQGGGKRKPFPKRTQQKYTYFGERLSSDLVGPLPASIHGEHYALCIVDSYTNLLSVYPLKSKSSEEVRAAFESYMRDHQKLFTHDRKITWHTDNGGEFMSSDLNEFCQEFAISRSFSIPYAPPQNSHAERMWGILLRGVRISLAESGVRESFWPYCMQHHAHIHNILPSTKLLHEITPHEAAYGEPPDVSLVRVWGCLTWYLLPERDLKSKISPRTVAAVHLGRDPQRNGYTIFIPSLQRITSGYHLDFQESRFVLFDSDIVRTPHAPRPLRTRERMYREERDEPTTNNGTHTHADNPRLANSDVTFPQQNEADHDYDHGDAETWADGHCSHADCTLGKHPDSVPHSFEQLNTRQRTSRGNPNYIHIVVEDVDGQDFVLNVDSVMGHVDTPSSYTEAIKGRLGTKWRVSMEKEITDLLANQTWELVSASKVPCGRRITKSKWVYAVKLRKDGTIDRFKSRFVVCGYSQVKGHDYTDSFSATLRATSFRLLCAIAAGKKMKLEHFDITNAFTEAKIDAEIYVEPPKGFETYDADGKPQVLRLLRALYGSKQASRLWQQHLKHHLVSKMGFTNSLHDPCLFVKHFGDGTCCMVGVYVDDIILAHNGKKTLGWFTDGLGGKGGFRAKHLGPLSWFIGIDVCQHDDYTVSLHQALYVDKLLEKFAPDHDVNGIKHSHPCNPDTFIKLGGPKDDDERERVRKLPYLQLIGSLLYLSTMTRPDIAYHMSVLCKFMQDPSLEAFAAAKSLLLYVGHTKHKGLHFDASTSAPPGLASCKNRVESNHGFVAYSDASWRDPHKFGWNMYGYVVYLYGAPVSFAAKLLKVVALSTAEAEYAAASQACREIQFVRNVCGDLGITLHGDLVLAVDNEAAIKIANNAGVTGRNKHFTDAIHYFREMVECKSIYPAHVGTHLQRADGFTKALDNKKFNDWQSTVVR